MEPGVKLYPKLKLLHSALFEASKAVTQFKGDTKIECMKVDVVNAHNVDANIENVNV